MTRRIVHFAVSGGLALCLFGLQKAPAQSQRPAAGRPGGPNAQAQADILESQLKPVVLPPGVTTKNDGQFTVTSGRPLALAAQILSQKLGVPISYEDAAWSSDGDVTVVPVPTTASRSTGPSVNKAPLLEPRAHTFDFTIPQNARSASPESVIESVINKHMSFHNPGEFKVVRFGKGEFSIVADFAADKVGKRLKQSVPLDVRISFPEEKRSLEGTISEICASIKSAAGITVLNYGPSGAYMLNNYIELGAKNEIARDVLARALGPRIAPGAPPTGRQAWMMFFEPTSQIYFLNLYSVQEEVTRRDGTKALRQLSWNEDNGPPMALRELGLTQDNKK